VLVYSRAADGSLRQIQEAATKGLGTGVTQDPLMSQGAVSLSGDGKLLFAVNPASGTLTAFRVTDSGLQFGSKAPSAGDLPVSVTEHAGVVYVLNQLGISNIAGFTVDASGNLKSIPNSARILAGKGLALPAQVSFTPDGTHLLVTEKGTDQIDIFTVQSDGRTTGQTVQPSSGHTPFGFAFGPSSSVVVTEAERRLPTAATASSYLAGAGGIQTASSAVPDHQGAACWVAITGDTAWVVNTLTSNISAYTIESSGTLSLANAVAASTGAGTGPIDIASTPDGQFVYILESAVGTLAAYRVNGNTLNLLSKKTGLPLSIQGLGVR
jgi:6-phosphogluconolactonase (cycloisomerase 2 family)